MRYEESEWKLEVSLENKTVRSSELYTVDPVYSELQKVFTCARYSL